MSNLIEISAPATLTTPAGSTSFNPGSGDGFYMTPDTTGYGQAPIRADVEDKPQADGANVHPGLRGGRPLLIVAQFLIVTGTIASRNAAIEALCDQLDSIVGGPTGTWTVTETGAAAKSLTVICDVGLVPSGGAQLKQVSFGLFAASPDWT